MLSRGPPLPIFQPLAVLSIRQLDVDTCGPLPVHNGALPHVPDASQRQAGCLTTSAVSPVPLTQRPHAEVRQQLGAEFYQCSSLSRTKTFMHCGRRPPGKGLRTEQLQLPHMTAYDCGRPAKRVCQMCPRLQDCEWRMGQHAVQHGMTTYGRVGSHHWLPALLPASPAAACCARLERAPLGLLAVLFVSLLLRCLLVSPAGFCLLALDRPLAE
jgi:hypothetical protein